MNFIVLAILLCAWANAQPCARGTFYDAVNGTCKACSVPMPGCMMCNDSKTCMQCLEGFILSEGKCMPGAPGRCAPGTFFNLSTNSCADCSMAIPNCMYCKNETYCTLCKGLNYEINGTCQPLWNILCPSGKYLNLKTFECDKCSDSLPNCTACLNSTHCSACTNQTVLINGKCSSTAEGLCPQGSYSDVVTGNCIPCIFASPNCTLCDNATTCLQCLDGTVLVNGWCLWGPNITCPSGYFMDAASSSCTSCSSAIYNCSILSLIHI